MTETLCLPLSASWYDLLHIIPASIQAPRDLCTAGIPLEHTLPSVTEADLTSTAPAGPAGPSTMLLFGVGMLGLAGYRWRRQTQTIPA
jgi:MYXO-CTERM domain-containing protein